jgi:hypothetical protein
MTKLVEKLSSCPSVAGMRGFPMEFRHVTSRTVNANKKRFEMVVAYRGHYVAGSYIHAHVAATEYTTRLSKKLPGRSFEWLGYDASNSHEYTFKFQYTT